MPRFLIHSFSVVGHFFKLNFYCSLMSNTFIKLKLWHISSQNMFPNLVFLSPIIHWSIHTHPGTLLDAYLTHYLQYSLPMLSKLILSCSCSWYQYYFVFFLPFPLFWFLLVTSTNLPCSLFIIFICVLSEKITFYFYVCHYTLKCLHV